MEDTQFSATRRDDFEVNYIDYYVASLSPVPKSITTVLKMRDSGCRVWCDVECQLDTGATCNVMNKDDLIRVTGKRDLRGMPRSTARLHLYDGSVIKPLGQYTFEVQRVPGLRFTFQIVRSYQKPLLSAKTCQNLGLITINSVSEATQDATSEPVTLQCDSSDFGLGATLMQYGQPVAFASRTLSPVEQRYAQIEKEILSIVFDCERFRQYICGQEVVFVNTDHKPLEMIFQKPLMMTPKRLQSMRLRLQDYYLKASHIPGRDMHIVDFLSRSPLPLQSSDLSPSTDCVFSTTKLLSETEIFYDLEKVNAAGFVCATDDAKNRMRNGLSDDAALQILKQIVLKDWPDNKRHTPSSVHEYWNFRDKISVYEGLLFRGNQAIVSKALRSDMIKQIHSVHLGMEACVRRARDILFWPGMQSDV